MNAQTGATIRLPHVCPVCADTFPDGAAFCITCGGRRSTWTVDPKLLDRWIYDPSMSIVGDALYYRELPVASLYGVPTEHVIPIMHARRHEIEEAQRDWSAEDVAVWFAALHGDNIHYDMQWYDKVKALVTEKALHER